VVTSAVEALAELRSSTAAMIRGVEAERWTDVDVHGPSLLPGWTRGHVLTHVARNADAISRALDGALRGEIVARYPQGRARRDADIQAGAVRGCAEQIADVRDSAGRLDQLFAAVADADGWELTADDRSAARWVRARWREVEIHRVDLAGAYTADQWPATFIRHLLPKLVDGLGERSSGALHIEIATTGSKSDLGGRMWTVGDGDATPVVGPDWAVLAWLVGRPVAQHVLHVTPELRPWL
jgi:maleylpyruvate isomerase